jgi:glycosyltransferase A (GT-A) superfamily protein (DUF2064 family)
MVKPSPDTALLLFIRSGYEEARYKQLGPGHRRDISRKLVKVFNKRTIRLAQHSGLSVFTITEEQQSGNTFGERFVNAVEYVFDKGFDKVITIGNDCLSLSRKHLSEAAQSLEKNELVLGPASDGGAYLIGLQKSFFQKEAIQDLPWQKPNLFKAFCRLAHSKGQIPVLLSEESDIDTFADLKRLLHQLTDSSFKKQICLLIGYIPLTLTSYSLSIHSSCYVSASGLRGPPLFQ